MTALSSISGATASAVSPRSAQASRMERAMGCVECDSARVASRSSSRESKPFRGSVRITRKVPWVRVPVLSMTTVETSLSASR